MGAFLLGEEEKARARMKVSGGGGNKVGNR